mgnify:CR=1 FL=1
MRTTMATCHAGKNLREGNRDEKAAALAFVKWNENGKFRVRHGT